MANDIIGVKEVKKLLQDVGKVSDKSITPASKKGAKMSLSYAKSHIMDRLTGKYSKGTLKRSLKIKLERRKKGKRVYQIGPNPEGWYAHFIDYGFTDRKGVYHQGNRFLRDSIDSQRDEINQTILTEMANEIDKLR